MPDSRRASRGVIFAVLSIVLFMSSVDITIVATGLPTIGHALHAQLNWTSWTVSAYQLGLVVAMPIAGRLSDALGHRRIVLSAAIVFVVSSIACAFATNVGELIAFRVIQALGGGAFAPAATGIVASAFGDRRAQAVGFFSTIVPVGAVAGPIIGGVIISAWSWRGIFLVNVPIGVIFVLLGLHYLPRPHATGERVSPWGSLLLGGALLALMLAVGRFGEPQSSVLSPGVAGFFGLGVVLLAVFWFYNARAPIPVVPIRFLRQRSFVAISTLNFVWGACAIGLITLFPLLAEERYSMTPLAAGSLLTAQAIGEIAIAAIAAVAIRRTGYRAPMFVGFALVAGGLMLAAEPPEIFGAYGWLMFSAAIIGVGTGASAPASNNAILYVSPQDVGTITGLRGASRQSGAIMAVALTTALVAHDAGSTALLRDAFATYAVVLLLLIPLIALVPNRDREHVPPQQAVSEETFAGSVAAKP